MFMFGLSILLVGMRTKHSIMNTMFLKIRHYSKLSSLINLHTFERLTKLFFNKNVKILKNLTDFNLSFQRKQPSKLGIVILKMKIIFKNFFKSHKSKVL